MNGCGYVPLKLCLQKRDAGHIRSTGNFAYLFGKICFFARSWFSDFFFPLETFSQSMYVVLYYCHVIMLFSLHCQGFVKVCAEGKDIFSDQKWYLKASVLAGAGSGEGAIVPCCARPWNVFWVFKVCSWKVYCKRNQKQKCCFYRISLLECVLGVSFKVINNLNVYIMWGINVIHTLKQNLTAKKDKPVGGFFFCDLKIRLSVPPFSSQLIK